MSQCVPSWDLHDDNPPRPSRSEYEIAELTWENGQVAMHGLGLPRLPNSKPSSWDKPRATGTLESIVNQATATSLPRFSKLPFDNQTLELTSGNNSDNHLVTSWFDNHQRCSVATSGAPSNTVTMDALVPNCRRNNNNNQHEEPNSSHIMDSFAALNNNNGCSTRVASCSAATAGLDRGKGRHAASAALVPATPEWNSRSGSATFGVDSQQVTIDTKGSDRDSVCHSIRRLEREGSDEEERNKRSIGKFSASAKRSRAAAVHNQSERKRRDKINQRMKTLQKLVPNSSKTDKASMLDEVIDYLKQLQAQVNVIKNMNMPAMMLPLAMQQQLQMSMMAQRNMGMGMPGMGIDMNIMNRPNIAGVAPILHPTAFMPMMTSWDVSAEGGAERLPGGSAAVMPDPLSAFLACQSQPMSMEAYSMMAAMYQQFHKQPTSSISKS